MAVIRVQVGPASVLDMGPADGAVLLMLHGIGGSAESCRAAGELLARGGRRVLCLDAPGYGESDDPGPQIDHVEWVVGLLDALGIARADLFGTSWGGVIATLVAVRYPDRVRALILADSTRGSATSPTKASAMRERVPELREFGPPVFAARRAPRLVSPHAGPDVRAQVETTMAQVRLSGYAAAAEFMATSNTEPMLSDITHPTLVLVGKDDVVTGVEESRLLGSRIPNARLVILERAGHSAVTERPAAVAAAIENFLEDL